MADVVLCEAEKLFIVDGVQSNFRNDGRTQGDFRSFELETGIITSANGSARLVIGNTDVMAGIKAEICEPLPWRPNSGRIEFFVDCSANATPAFEGRGGDELAIDLISALTRAYDTPLAFDYKSLCILPSQQCWKLNIDIVILNYGGNLYDVVSIAIKAALFNARIPRVASAVMDGGEPDLQISDDPFDCERVSIENLPTLVTVCKIGNNWIVDPTAVEEICSSACAVVAVNTRNNRHFVSSFNLIGEGSLQYNSIKAGTKLAIAAAVNINQALTDILETEERMFGLQHREQTSFLNKKTTIT